MAAVRTPSVGAAGASSRAAGLLAAAIVAGCGSSHGGSGDAGAVVVEAGFSYVAAPSDCPGIASFSVDTIDLQPGQSAQASIETVGPPPTFLEWTGSPASAIVFADAGAVMTAFRCSATAPESATVTVNVGIQSAVDANACEGVAYTSYSASVRCER